MLLLVLFCFFVCFFFCFCFCFFDPFYFSLESVVGVDAIMINMEKQKTVIKNVNLVKTVAASQLIWFTKSVS